jgi:DNA-binding CsgD family transcriptional regulator
MTEGLIDHLYECAFVPEQWPETLEAISRLAGARGATLCAATGSKISWVSSRQFIAAAPVGIPDGILFQSPFIGRMNQSHHAGFLRAGELVSQDEMAGDPLFRDVLVPAGLGHVTGTIVHASTGEKLVLVMLNETLAGQTNDATLVQLDALRPHLARTMLTSARLALERARAATQTLDMLGLPALVFAGNGKVTAANPAIEALGGLIHWRSADRIAFVDRAAEAQFQLGLAALGHPGAAAPMSFAIRSAEGRPAMVAHIIPVRRTARDIFALSAGVLMLTPLTLSQAPAVELVQSLFDLTPAEARVARNLTSGQSVEQIAASSGVATSTIRSHVRGVLEKTGCTRQAEVISLLGGAVLLPG